MTVNNKDLRESPEIVNIQFWNYSSGRYWHGLALLRPGLSSNLATKETFTAFVQLLHRHWRWKYLFVFCTTPINGFVKTTRIQFNLPLCHEQERADMLNSNLLPLPPSAISIQCHTSGFCFHYYSPSWYSYQWECKGDH